ncbi:MULTISPECIES: Fe-S cluster assembly protein HesB [Actinomadura]|uniref:Fe-S cluster assembly protein HesB n=1 Tax=Actinomadura yumaensis TaxID=111807 RepID=A0ABW2CRT1_9ACTN|nr:Fe-S cluster assembly protein HesB [Actinomadura sp. J1-007]MWK34086.1 Fe-S cluster assembly protein HesB [Actinomadura sp. J1-007]
MLMLTGAAVTAIRNLVYQPDVPYGSGVRIAPHSDDESLLALTPSPLPAASDEVLETEGARVFLAPTAVGFLTGKVLDARVDEQGEVRFLINAPSR